MSIRNDYVQYWDGIASQFGANPNLLRLLFTDLSLFTKIIFGPNLSYRYRLQGPHVGYGVREAIMTSDDRMSWPFTKGKTDETRDNIFKVLFQTVIKLLRIL
ncbi:UNVERIFIED_CONTAM: Dimethylaniline monooxygenase [N-oxide-forming] 5 [Trichonephila clavipes]